MRYYRPKKPHTVQTVLTRWHRSIHSKPIQSIIMPSKFQLLSICLLVMATTERTDALVPPKIQSKNRQLHAKAPASFPAEIFAAGIISSAFILNPAPAVAADAVSGTPLEAPIVQISEAAWPVFNALPEVAPLAGKFLSVIDQKIPAAKATDALNKGIDAFLAIPDDKIATFATTLSASSYGGVSGDSCSAIPGTQSTAAQFASLSAVKGVDSTKLKSLETKYASANKAVTKTTSGDICLPASEKGLEALWIGQTELTLNIPKAESVAFAGSLKTALSSVPAPEWLRLLPDVKKTIGGSVDVKTSLQLEKAGKALEKAFQGDARIQKRLTTN